MSVVDSWITSDFDGKIMSVECAPLGAPGIGITYDPRFSRAGGRLLERAGGRHVVFGEDQELPALPLDGDPVQPGLQ